MTAPTAVPFSTPELVVLDSLRLLVGVAGFLLVGSYLWMRWRFTNTRSEQARILGIALSLFVLAGSRVLNLGGPFAWQLVAAAVAFTLVGYGLLDLDRKGRE